MQFTDHELWSAAVRAHWELICPMCARYNDNDTHSYAARWSLYLRTHAPYKYHQNVAHPVVRCDCVTWGKSPEAECCCLNLSAYTRALMHNIPRATFCRYLFQKCNRTLKDMISKIVHVVSAFISPSRGFETEFHILQRHCVRPRLYLGFRILWNAASGLLTTVSWTGTNTIFHRFSNLPSPHTTPFFVSLCFFPLDFVLILFCWIKNWPHKRKTKWRHDTGQSCLSATPWRTRDTCPSLPRYGMVKRV